MIVQKLFHLLNIICRTTNVYNNVMNNINIYHNIIIVQIRVVMIPKMYHMFG